MKLILLISLLFLSITASASVSFEDQDYPNEPSENHRVIIKSESGLILENYKIVSIDLPRQSSSWNNVYLWLSLNRNDSTLSTNREGLDFIVIKYNSWSLEKNLKKAFLIWEQLVKSRKPITIYLTEGEYSVEDKTKSYLSYIYNGVTKLETVSESTLSHFNYRIKSSKIEVSQLMGDVLPLNQFEKLNSLSSLKDYVYWDYSQEPAKMMRFDLP